jgi:hypothetical protein
MNARLLLSRWSVKPSRLIIGVELQNCGIVSPKESIKMSISQRLLAALGGVLGLAGVMFTEANASVNATFECAAGAAQVCYFSILRQPGGTQNFVVQGHQRTAIAGLAPGRDWYLVAVNHPAPASLNACQHANFRCKVAIVHLGVNQ